MFNFLYQYGQAVTQERQAQVWLPGDTAPTTEWFPWVAPIDTSVALARWEDDGGLSL